MDTVERDALIRELRDNRENFCASAYGLSEAQARFKSSPDRWSIEECVEHVALVEKRFLDRITSEFTPSDSSNRPDLERHLRATMANRADRRKAPDPVQPTGRFGSLPAAIGQFSVFRDATIAYLSSCQDNLRSRTITHPVLGTITCHEAFLIILGHPLRHADQIREIKASAGYPV